MYNLLSDEKPENDPQLDSQVSSIPDGGKTMLKQASAAPHSARSKNKKQLPLWAKRVIGYSLIALAIFLFVGYFLVYVPAMNVYAQSMVVADQLRLVGAYGKEQNIIEVQNSLPKAQEELTKLRKEAGGLMWTKIIPFVGDYYRDFEHGLNAADAGLKAGEQMVKVVAPYADLLGLRGKGSFTGSAQDRIARLVDTMDKIIPELDSIKPHLATVKNEMNKINPDRYAFDPKIQTNVTNAIEQANQIESLLNEAKPFLSVLPQILGRDKTASYMVVFQNDKELRATGGFITAFARLTVDKGRVINSESSDIYKIDQQLRLKLTPPAAMQKYLPEPNGKTKTHWQIRDSNFYPDFKQSAALFESIYEYYKSKEYVSLTEDQMKVRQATDWDGLIAVDTYVVEGIIRVLGPVEVDGKKFTSENDARCNCPQVVYELESHAERSASGNTERKALIGDLMQEILLQAFKQEEKIPLLANEAIRLMNQKHVLVYMHDQKLQETIENLDWGGRLASADNPTKFGYEEGKWDYWHWNESNFAGAKANLYIQQESEHNYEIAGDGTVTKTVNVTVENKQKNDWWLNGRYRAYFRAYVPGGSQLIASSGSRDAVTVTSQYGKTVFDGFFEVFPQKGPVKIQLKYRLPFKAKKGDTFKALFQKQAGTTQFQYVLKGIGDKQEFDLSQDRKVEVKI